MPRTLQLLGHLDREPGPVGDFASAGNHLYLANDDTGVRVVDVADPAAPTCVGTYRTANWIRAVAVSGTTVIVAENDTQLSILDVDDPTQPRLVGSCTLPESIQDVGRSEKYAFVLLSESLRVFDLADAAAPREIGKFEGLELAQRITVVEGRVYVAADFNGMIIFDVTKPTKPRKLGEFTGPGNVTEIAVAGNLAFLADYSGGLHIIDITDPKRPKELSEHGDYLVGDVAIVEGHALVAAGMLEVLDVSKPAKPKRVAMYSREDCDVAWSVLARGEIVYTLGSRGVFIFRLK